MLGQHREPALGWPNRVTWNGAGRELWRRDEDMPSYGCCMKASHLSLSCKLNLPSKQPGLAIP